MLVLTAEDVDSLQVQTDLAAFGIARVIRRARRVRGYQPNCSFNRLVCVMTVGDAKSRTQVCM